MSGFIIRPTTADDLAAVDAVLARSYPRLLKEDYPPSVLVTALPLISHANPALLSSGTYYLAEDRSGRVLGAGGWTRQAPGGGSRLEQLWHVRHLVTDHTATRRGVGRALMEHIIAQASAARVAHLNCLSTITAVPFYRAMGFEEVGPRNVQLRRGIVFPSIEMVRDVQLL